MVSKCSMLSLSLNPVSQHFFRESTLIKCASIFHCIWRICRSSFRRVEAWECNWVTKNSLLYGANCTYTLKWLKPSSRSEKSQWLLYPLIPSQTAVDGVWINICWKREWQTPNSYPSARLLQGFPRFMIKLSQTPIPVPQTLLLIMLLQADIDFLSGQWLLSWDDFRWYDWRGYQALLPRSPSWWDSSAGLGADLELAQIGSLM